MVYEGVWVIMSVVSTNNKDKIIYNNLPKNIDNHIFKCLSYYVCSFY